MMKITLKPWMTIPFVCLLILAAGCTSTIRGSQVDAEQAALEQIKTRDDALLAFGTPSNIALDGNDRLYYFTSGMESGGHFGLGSMLWQVIFIGREHLVNDTLIVRVDRNGRVVSFEPLIAQPIRRSKIWPGY